jgi:hypothetical protein
VCDVTTTQITELGIDQSDDYPELKARNLGEMSQRWITVDERQRAGEPIDDVLAEISYKIGRPRRWKQIDVVRLVPGIAVSARGRLALESLNVDGMKFFPFTANNEPWFLFMTERVIDCLDRSISEVTYFDSSPERALSIQRYAFFEDQLDAVDLFAIPEMNDGMFFWTQRVFVTAKARDALEASGAIGFRFEELPTEPITS